MRRPSSVNAAVLGPSANLAVSASWPAVELEPPMPTASDEPRLSNRVMCGACFSRPCLFSWLQTVPEELITRSLLKSQRPGWAFRVCSIGWAKAWPTMVTPVTPSRSTSDHNSTVFSRCDGRVAIAPAPVSALSAVNWAVACISGAAASTSRRTDPSLVSDASARSPASAGVSSGGSASIRLPPPPSTLNRSSWRHITPLGMPVVPPVYISRRSSPERPQGAITRSSALPAIVS